MAHPNTTADWAFLQDAHCLHEEYIASTGEEIGFLAFVKYMTGRELRFIVAESKRLGFGRDKRRPRNPEYRAYLHSPEWKKLRAEIIAERGSQCERCKAVGPVDAHHRTYSRLFHELKWDIELLCHDCHAEHHHKQKRERRKRRRK